MAENKMDLVDSVFDGFVVDAADDSATKRGCVNIWIPEEYREKFQELQNRSKRRFGKKVQEMVIKAIDKVSDL